jgi:hypothetical protein
MSIKGIAVGLLIIALIAGATWYFAGGSIPTSTSATQTPSATTSETPSPVTP